MPVNYKNYPTNWKSEVRPAILNRADHSCEECGVPNYAIGYRDQEGQFRLDTDFNEYGEEDSCEVKVIRIVLTISHTDHDVTNNAPSNLRALCQRCHLANDREHNKRQRQINHRKKEMKRGQLAFDFSEEEIAQG